MDRQKEKILFLEILATSLEPSGHILDFNKYLAEKYLELKKVKNSFLEPLQEKYDGISQKYFNENNNIEEWEERTDKSAKALARICNRIVSNTEYEIVNIEGVESEYIQAIYNHYKRKKGSNPEKPFTFKKLKLSENNIQQLDQLVTEFGKQILTLNLLKEISDHLSFFEFYSSKPKKIVNKCADACWDLYYSKTENGEKPEKLNLNRDEFRAIILNSYHVRYYQRWPQKETDKKMKDAISQWFRDIKENNSITIPK